VKNIKRWTRLAAALLMMGMAAGAHAQDVASTIAKGLHEPAFERATLSRTSEKSSLPHNHFTRDLSAAKPTLLFTG
jgi:hypothetical protein